MFAQRITSELLRQHGVTGPIGVRDEDVSDVLQLLFFSGDRPFGVLVGTPASGHRAATLEAIRQVLEGESRIGAVTPDMYVMDAMVLDQTFSTRETLAAAIDDTITEIASNGRGPVVIVLLNLDQALVAGDGPEYLPTIWNQKWRMALVYLRNSMQKNRRTLRLLAMAQPRTMDCLFYSGLEKVIRHTSFETAVSPTVTRHRSELWHPKVHSLLSTFEAEANKRLPGQEHAISIIDSDLTLHCMGFSGKEAARGLLFVGFPGSGKAALARFIADHLFEGHIIVIEGAEYADADAGHRIRGFPTESIPLPSPLPWPLPPSPEFLPRTYTAQAARDAEKDAESDRQRRILRQLFRSAPAVKLEAHPRSVIFVNEFDQMHENARYWLGVCMDKSDADVGWGDKVSTREAFIILATTKSSNHIQASGNYVPCGSETSNGVTRTRYGLSSGIARGIWSQLMREFGPAITDGAGMSNWLIDRIDNLVVFDPPRNCLVPPPPPTTLASLSMPSIEVLGTGDCAQDITTVHAGATRRAPFAPPPA